VRGYMSRHARGVYLVQDDSGYRLFESNGECPLPAGFEPLAFQSTARTYAYKHIFGIQEDKHLPPEAALVALGEAMAKKPYDASAHSGIPAGYTYLGQFIFHDISMMNDKGTQHWKPLNERTPALDLDSVLASNHPDETTVGCHNSRPMALGCTSGDLDLAEDLPREPVGTPEAGKPHIGDPRNDDFLPLAQCHVVLLKFYNTVARSQGYDPPHDDAWWANVRRIWIEHFQSVVLHDYLPRIVDPVTYQDVMHNGRQIIRTNSKARNDPWLPIEFAGAFARFGHSMIRDGYQNWNRLLDFRLVTLTDFMRFSYTNSDDALAEHSHRLLAMWVTNWFRLFDFTDTPFGGVADRPNMSAPIDTSLAPQLAKLPECMSADICKGYPHPDHTFSLALQTLKRGRGLKLASAQKAIAAINKKLATPIPSLAPDQLAGPDPNIAAVLRQYPQLAKATPLWFYMLREAEYLANGQHLGPLASRIVMETLHAAIEASADSILAHPDWRPAFPSVSGVHFSMPDLIAAAGHPNPLAQQSTQAQ
jgi:hypothetical protein